MVIVRISVVVVIISKDRHNLDRVLYVSKVTHTHTRTHIHTHKLSINASNRLGQPTSSTNRACSLAHGHAYRPHLPMPYVYYANTASAAYARSQIGKGRRVINAY